MTFAVIVVEIPLSVTKPPTLDQLLDAVRDSVTEWVATTKEGKEAWEASSEDFNIGDLANEDISPISKMIRKKHGYRIVSIEAHSTDAVPSDWTFDSILVDATKI